MVGRADGGSEAARDGVFDSYVIAGDPLATPPAGARLALRPSGPSGLALHTGDGRRLGLLPPAEAEALRQCLGEAMALRAHVRAIVPCRPRPRILVRFRGA